MPGTPLQPQQIEILGRSILIEQLLRADLEVASPARDRGVDLIAYADLAAEVNQFIARPIQMKAASIASFSINRKYEQIRDLILTQVWNVDSPDANVVYAMTYAESVNIGDQCGYTATESWRNKGKYSRTTPDANLRAMMQPFRMTPQRWRALIVGAPAAGSIDKAAVARERAA